MKPGKTFSTLLVIACCLFLTPGVSMAQDTGSSGSSNPFGDLLMNILQEGIDEWIGNYKGSLGDVKLLERLGNRVVLEVTYNNVKRSDNVYVQGEVLDMGAALEGFKNSLNSVSGSQGKVRLAIRWAPEEDEDWGTVQSQVVSDQIRLYLIRKSNPEKPFGEIVYDMTKVWTDSNEPDVEESTVADADGIELADEEAETGISAPEPSQPSKPAGIFVKPGTILIPKTQMEQVKPAQPGTVQTIPSTPSKTTTPPVVTSVKPIQAKPLVRIDAYDFFSKAESAVWKSSAGSLKYPGAVNDPRGYARPVAKSKINPNNSAISMIEMRPEKKSTGWIDAHFPAIILGDNLKFKAVAGFLFGAKPSNSAAFQVYVKTDNRYHRLISKRIAADKYQSLVADLSQWAGKKVQIVLRVRASAAGSPKGAVWVKPRISK